ncbi:hypothetical protein GCM10011519_35610 [Marmoricola endophyticus]|uniref:Glyoxalase-like domain-containing protein n=1 Tax=Marmoricola endophyticus TaxID=2040280 RepID=A0A917BWB4_9ACTN|nr:VOC family protein [Marmoricola endophyticus]GGF58665.1 hypothetical protein GCM10011519_35610 [Marmoricola endophyticus]
MTSTRLAMTTIDCADVGAESAFWAALLELEVVATDHESYAMLRGSEGPALGFGRVEGYEPPPWPNEGGTKQFHLDVAVADVAAAEARAVELGATLADPQPGETWRVLLDPAGHPFCLTDASSWG